MIHDRISLHPVLVRLSGILLVAFSCVQAQQAREVAWPDVPKIGIGAGMTVCGINANELTDYMNSLSGVSRTIGSWNVAGEFSAASEFHLTGDLSLKVEYAYLLNSHSIDDPLTGGNIDVSYGVHMPSVILHYMIIGSEGYFLKFGGGAGYYIASLEQKFPSYLGTSQSSASGIGVKLDVSGQTPLGDGIFFIIGGNMRFSFMGDFHGGVFGEVSGPVRAVSMNFITIGATMGFIYYF